MRHYDPWWHHTPDRNLGEEELIHLTDKLFNTEHFDNIEEEYLSFIQDTHISINDILAGKSGITLWDAYLMGTLLRFTATRFKNANKYTYLESGTSFGGSSIFARKILDYLDKPKQTVITIDPFGFKDFLSGETATEDIFIENMDKCGVDRIKLIVGSSYTRNTHEAVTSHPKDYKLHTLFIDGDHTYNGAASDWYTWSSLILPYGNVIFHDYKMEPSPDANYGIKRFVNNLDIKEEWIRLGHIKPANMYALRKQW